MTSLLRELCLNTPLEVAEGATTVLVNDFLSTTFIAYCLEKSASKNTRNTSPHAPLITKKDLFRLCPPPQISGRILFAPPKCTCHIFLRNDLLCNGTCSVTGGRITYPGHKRKRSTKKLRHKPTKVGRIALERLSGREIGRATRGCGVERIVLRVD